jgi:cytochrome c5
VFAGLTRFLLFAFKARLVAPPIPPFEHSASRQHAAVAYVDAPYKWTAEAAASHRNYLSQKVFRRRCKTCVARGIAPKLRPR